MASNLSGQVRSIVEVAKAVTSGDLSKKIVVDDKGKTVDLKETVNESFQLARWYSEEHFLLHRRSLHIHHPAASTKARVSTTATYSVLLNMPEGSSTTAHPGGAQPPDVSLLTSAIISAGQDQDSRLLPQFASTLDSSGWKVGKR